MPEIINVVIPLVVGLVLIIIGFEQKRKTKRLVNNGIEVEGVIFSKETSSDSKNRAIYPVIRFVTKDGVWVTEKASESLPFFLKKDEKTVQVFYDPNNPKEFIYKTSAEFFKVTNILIIAGILFFMIGLWLCYQYLIK
ncbi:MAG: DUF3592 domain-containing protein [Chitinophagaceae bacterium]|nr:DUF3592 domain-containing protein [Chitinophagaceae bacterium]